MRVSHFLYAVGFGTVAIVGGCASQDSSDGAGATTPPVLGDGQAAEEVHPAALALVAGPAVRFNAMGEEPGFLSVAREALAGTPTPQFTQIEVTQMDGKKPVERRVTLIQLADGTVAMPREENKGERVVVEYEPPLVIYPARLVAGEPFEQQVRMTVRPIANPERVQAQGDARHTIRFEGRERIQPAAVGAEAIDAVKMVAVLEADLGGPKVFSETQEWLSPVLGTVAIKQSERTMVLGVKVRANSSWWVFSEKMGK